MRQLAIFAGAYLLYSAGRFVAIGDLDTATDNAHAIVDLERSVGADVADAHRRAHECDPTSAFGGVIAVNRPVSVEMAQQVAEIFTEVIVAPAYDEGTVEVLQAKKNIRILVCAADEHPAAGR